MYLYQPCLLSMVLSAWAFDLSPKKWHMLMIWLPLLILAISEIEVSCARISLYPSALLLPVFSFTRIRHADWAGISAAALLGGFLCWKIVDLWPLLSVRLLISASIMSFTVWILCRSKEDRNLACAMGGVFFELFFCLREYTLFSFCVIRLGSRDALSLVTASLCLRFLVNQLRLVLFSKRKHAVSIGN